MPLKSPEKVLRNALVTNTSVTAIVSTRIYPVLAPASAALPFITYRRAGVSRSQSLAGPIGLPTVNLEVEVYDTTYNGARELADVCRVALDGYGGTFDTVTVANTSLENEVDGFVALAGGEVPPVYSVTQNYNVLWNEG
jgi:hypothetical protein